MHCILFYEYVPDIAEKRGPHRSAHLQAAKRSFEKGDMVMAGAFAEPLDGAALVFRSVEAAQQFAQSDPYVLNGLVSNWRVRKWQTVIGDGAKMPDVTA